MTQAPPVALNLTGLTEAGVGSGGISDREIAAIADRAASAVVQTRELRASGSVGFFDLPDAVDQMRAVMDYARGVPAEIDTMVVLGIGGSSLGPHAVYSALAHPMDSHRSRAAGLPRRLFFPDNPDPASFRALLEHCPPEKTLYNVVTKSGGTAETAAQLLVVADRIQQQLGAEALAKHLVVTTDPQRGPLHAAAQRFGLTEFPIPESVGGRFSVLSAVGLLPAAVAGLDVAGLLDGARWMRDRVADETDVLKNPSLMLASLLHLHEREHGRPIVVMMPYVDGLYDCADWFKQLWAESLGKGGQGPTPVASRGATDQHSQLQLYAEGPDDKTYLFVTVADRGVEVTIPGGDMASDDAYQYLVGRGMGELLDAELAGTRMSLTARGRPNGLITLSRPDARSLGAFIMLLEAATAFAGPLGGINPYDQPGVEEAKRLAYAAFGRAGYESLAADANRGRDHDPRYVF